MDLVPIVNKILSLGTMGSQALLIAFLVYLLFLRKKYPAVAALVFKHALLLAFIYAAIATAGSLFYSEVAGYTPCKLCWLQRIFMYPLVIILGIALFKKDASVVKYVLSLSVLGLLFALYHNFIKYGGVNILCIGNGGTDCLKQYVFEFGYVTIPTMSVTAFAVIIVCMMVRKLQKIQ